MASTPEMPAMLYKHGTEIEWDHEWFDTLVVTDDDELEAALKDGWSVGKPDPLDHDGDGKKEIGRAHV